MILAVGYRVNSKIGILFRRWANKVLKEYLVDGYAINNKRRLALNKKLINNDNIIIKAINSFIILIYLCFYIDLRFQLYYNINDE